MERERRGLTLIATLERAMNDDDILAHRESDLRYLTAELEWLERHARASSKQARNKLDRRLAQLRQLRDQGTEIFERMINARDDQPKELSDQFDHIWASCRTTLKFFKREMLADDTQPVRVTSVAASTDSELDVEHGALRCPKCAEHMSKVHYGDVMVDRCDACRGLWFDLLEHEVLAAINGSESIDDGDSDVGRHWNQLERIACPVCRSPMIAMVDPRQPHIWYEACTSCHGVFFDAGEFRDYKERTFLDLFRQWFASARS